MSQMLANGIRLNYESLGDPQNPSLILIRGLGTQMVEWQPDLLQGLQNLGLRVVVFDNRDVGLSEKLADKGLADFGSVLKGEQSAPYGLKDMASDVCGLMDGLNIDQAHIMGISLGGMIAQVMAAEFPNRVASLMSVMSSSGSAGLPGPTAEAQQAFNEPAAKTLAEAIEQTVRSKVVFGSPGYPEALPERQADAQTSVARCYYPEGVARQRLAIATQMDRSALLKTIATPTTVIHGEDDILIPLACGEDTARLIPNAHFEAVAGMGHNIPRLLVPHYVELIAEHFKRIGVQL